MTTQIADLVGLTEIAETYGVTKNVASGWTRKHHFPQPVHTLRMGPMWDRTQVEAWINSRKDPHGVRYQIPCAHCGGPTMHAMSPTVDDINAEVRLACYADDSHKTRLVLTHTSSEKHIQTTVVTYKEDA
jgi:predicted DNA-binding transcriptional regulator AlpA